MKTLLSAVVVVSIAGSTLLGCNKERSARTSSTASSASGDLAPDTVVAKIGSESITVADVDAQAKKDLFQVRKQQLEQMINERLVKAEAQKKGLTEEDFIKKEADDKVPPPSDEQIKKLFDENASQLPKGATLEQYKPQIVQFLSRGQVQQKRKELIERLRSESHVQITLPEPRTPVEAKGPSRGPDNAKVTIVEFSDFECPYCGRAYETVEQVMNNYPGKVKLVFRQFPLAFHPHAEKSAEASLCAEEQGKFWPYYDALFKNQKSLEPAQLKEHAKAVGLDAAKFDQCLESGKFAKKVKDDQEAGSKAGVNGTPAFFINGVLLSGAQPYEEFKRVIDQELGS